MLIGEHTSVLLEPQYLADLDRFEGIVPQHSELRNGHVTLAGNWERRPGMVEAFDLGVTEPVVGLIPEGPGYAITRAGHIYRLDTLADITVTATGGAATNRQTTGGGGGGSGGGGTSPPATGVARGPGTHQSGIGGNTTVSGTGATGSNATGPFVHDPQQAVAFWLKGVHRPTWTNVDGVLIVANGAHPVAINQASRSAALLGGPPRAKFVAVLDSFLLLAGEGTVTIRWGEVGSITAFPLENSNEVAREGEVIEMMQVHQRRIYFWKSASIEVWVHVAGEFTFARQTRIERGTPAGHSVVQANDTFYFYGDDGHFYVLNGLAPELISGKIRKRLLEITNRTDCYGFDFADEHVIRRFFPTDHRCFAYDYRRGEFTEDATWQHAQDEALPIASHMELNGTTYVGDANPTGRIYAWTTTSREDRVWLKAGSTLGIPIRMPRQWRVGLSAEGKRTRVHRFRLRIKRGDQWADAERALHHARFGHERRTALLRWRFDERPWTRYHHLDLGAVGDHFPYIDLYSLGSGHEIEFELVHAEDSIDYRAVGGMLTHETLGP